MGAVVVVGAQWGDEGKGKIVDIYAQYADQVVRYGGGANAGHTLVVDGQKLVFHLIPSGALHPGKRCVLGQGTVIDPAVLLDEIHELQQRNLFSSAGFVISERAFLVLPQHIMVDKLREQRVGALGTTGRGIGPAYEDKVGRRGLRMGDLLSRDKFARKLDTNLETWRPTIEALGGTVPAAEGILVRYMELARELAPFISDAAGAVRDTLRGGQRVLLEGAQGTLLDIDSGTYPFVTSSTTIAGGACSGAGIGPTEIDRVVGITKAYTTRVGVGPFPTELDDDVGHTLREAGGEYGATTGRPRRCGWLDIPALRYAVQVNGLDGLALTKIDVLTGMPEIRMCTRYKLAGKELDTPPYDELDRVEPVYETFPGWSESISHCRKLDELPANARSYLAAIERLAGCPLWLVSVGADREQTIVLKNPYDA